MLGQTGEYLCLSDEKLMLRPVLAESWTSNSDGTVWTFKIRKGVKFSNGQPLTADDVVYTYKLNSNPTSSANALSAFGGVLLPDGVQKVNDYEVAFHLESANGNFPYLCSSDTYNMIILPNNYDPAKWENALHRDGAVRHEDLHEERRGHLCPQRELLGDEGSSDRDAVHVLRRPGASDHRPAGGHDRRHRPVLGHRRRGALERRLQRDQVQVVDPPGAVDAL